MTDKSSPENWFPVEHDFAECRLQMPDQNGNPLTWDGWLAQHELGVLECFLAVRRDAAGEVTEWGWAVSPKLPLSAFDEAKEAGPVDFTPITRLVPPGMPLPRYTALLELLVARRDLEARRANDGALTHIRFPLPGAALEEAIRRAGQDPAKFEIPSPPPVPRPVNPSLAWGVSLGPRPAKNGRCWCGSGRKYKGCCYPARPPA